MDIPVYELDSEIVSESFHIELGSFPQSNFFIK